MSSAAIVVPAYNAAATLGTCLSALASGPHAASILVVDNGSTDDTAAIARRHGAEVLCIDGPSGPAAARNTGVAVTTSDIIVFVDADVIASPAAVSRLLGAFETEDDLAAAFGSYDANPVAPGVPSRFKNLLHHFVHQQADERSTSFWAGFGAIRRDAFDAVGGFDAARYRRPSIEDIELGTRLWRARLRVRLVREAQVTHVKTWTLRQLVTTDVRDRAYPWTRLLLDTQAPAHDLNLRTRDRVSALVAWSAVIAIGTTIVAPRAGAALALTAVVLLVVLNRRLYRFFAGADGWRFAAAAFGLHLLYYLYSSATYAVGVLLHLARTRAS
ncbi:MAG: glycosyltransferase [Acidobacteria bacterium]|nr:glycosyltransferase [Acidobacteriota bacterium]